MSSGDPNLGRDPGAATLGWSAERIALDDARHRDANELISDRAIELGFTNEELPFLCECADPGCQQVVRMDLSEYENVRAEASHFLYVHGHTAAAQQFGRVVEDHERYVVLEKLGRAREVAELTDPRQDEVA